MAIPLEFGEAWIEFTVTGDNEPMYTHLAYGVSGTLTQSAIDAGFTAAATQLKTIVSPSVSITGGHFLEQTSAGIRRWDASITPQVGTATGNPLPNNCAILIRKSTALGGRRNRGRMFIPCPNEANVDGAGLLTTAYVTSINTAVGTLMPGGSVHTAFGQLGDAVVLHETGSQTPTTITDLGCQPKIATQRRRMRR